MCIRDRLGPGAVRGNVTGDLAGGAIFSGAIFGGGPSAPRACPGRAASAALDHAALNRYAPLLQPFRQLLKGNGAAHLGAVIGGLGFFGNAGAEKDHRLIRTALLQQTRVGLHLSLIHI